MQKKDKIKKDHLFDTIEHSVTKMDNEYGANFMEWIKNEQNCKLIGSHLKKYINLYRESKTITTIKWISADWTLRSIILLSRVLLLDPPKSLNECDHTKYKKSVPRIMFGCIYTWNPIFIGEYLLSVTSSLNNSEKSEILYQILNEFNSDKLKAILTVLDKKCNKELKILLLNKFKNRIYMNNTDKWERTDSFLDAMKFL
ncbi:hypothetical protein A0H76_2059 [Hepatospora eriocheir]|uniref:Uncharacterized protein n=1 Tax=Hepatospora eriocheir TaxID=1081669 RepID=A0A1X0QKF7_9MICR|nr:hypothetical protein A0H76_2059 [Hepatospora eriocheir]